MKYTIDGHEVAVKYELPDGRFVVAFIYEEHYGDESQVVESDHLSVVNDVFNKPPRKKMEEEIRKAKDELDSLRKQTIEERSKKHKVTMEIRDAENKAKETLERIKKYRGLENIEDFIDGNITFVLDVEYQWNPEIFPFEDYIKNSDQGMKLISLYGKSNGDLTFKVNEYGDGSGSSRQAFFFTSLEEAVEKLQAFITEQVSEGNHRPRQGYVALAKKYNLELPEGYAKTLEDEYEENNKNKIKDLKAELAELESKSE